MKKITVVVMIMVGMVIMASYSFAHEHNRGRHHHDFGREILGAAIVGATEGFVNSVIPPPGRYYAPPQPVVYRHQYRQDICTDDVWVPAVVRWNPRYRVYEEMRPGYYKKVRVSCY